MKSGFIHNVLKIAIFTLAGLFTLMALDKFAKGKLPGYDEELFPGLNLKLAWFVLAFVLSHLVVNFIGVKTRIKLLQNPCHR